MSTLPIRPTGLKNRFRVCASCATGSFIACSAAAATATRQSADFLIVTSDNPRFEDAYDIITQIEPGIQKVGTPYVTISDREMATEYAINLLGEGDILLVAGKGGETYQEIMGIKHSYNDNTIIKKILGNLA